MGKLKILLQGILVIALVSCQRNSLELSKDDYQREVTAALKHISTSLAKHSGARSRGLAAVDDSSVDGEAQAQRCQAWISNMPSGRSRARQALLARCVLSVIHRANENARALYRDAGREGQRYWKEISTPFAPGN